LPQIRLYDLRHTCATPLLITEENPKVVSERLGHSTIMLTLDTYSHVLSTMQQSDTKRLEKLLYSKRNARSSGTAVTQPKTGANFIPVNSWFYWRRRSESNRWIKVLQRRAASSRKFRPVLLCPFSLVVWDSSVWPWVPEFGLVWIGSDSRVTQERTAQRSEAKPVMHRC